MRDIVIISFTPLSDGGGVPRWNRDFIAGFPGARHYSWWDAAPSVVCNSEGVFEWDKAHVLSAYLKWSKKVKPGDIVIADGFWAAGYDPKTTICVRHGIWSHLTKEDVDAGKQPDFPRHHITQVNFTRKFLAAGGKCVAVSDFIARQCKLQWNFDMPVINNAIDLEKFKPVPKPKRRPLVIHGVNDKGNENKGWSHIQEVRKALPGVDVMSLDEATAQLGMPKYEALASADLVVVPSGYEGNSYFVLESLACDVPVVGYNVGLLNSISEICHREGIPAMIGCVIDRKFRSPQETAKVVKFILGSVLRDRTPYNPRQVASLFSVSRFHEEWRKYLEDYGLNLPCI